VSRKLTLVAGLALFVALIPQAGGALPNGTAVQTYKSGLNFPIDMAWVKGTKRIFFTEKSGAIRVMVGKRLLSTPCVTLDVNSEGESGALGIALHPHFKSNHKLYVFYSNASPHENRVSSFVVDNNRCTQQDNVVTGLNASSGYHNGGQIEFVNGKLFVSTGEDHSPAQAQSTTNRLGKILRYNPDGTVPNDNPFGASNPVWSYGHRNPFGLAHKPGTGKIYSSENGPDCDDELNYIRRGRNYGWGANYQCGTAGRGTNPKAPIVRWSSIIVPTDPTWYKGKLAALNGLLMGDYGNGDIHRFVMNTAKTRVRRDRIVYNGSDGIVDVSKGPGGWLYFLTNNAMKRIVKT
jgi:glucose/arabinose dehydrogenase